MTIRHHEFGGDNHRSRSNSHLRGHYHETGGSRQAVNPNRTTMFHGEMKSINEVPLGIQLHGAPEGHAAGFTGKGIRVGVIDSGCDMNNELFEGKLIAEHVYLQETDGKLDDEPHGTHVAGTINMMAPDAEIIGYRVFGSEAIKGGPLGLSGSQTTNEAIAMAISKAVDDGCNIINMSLGTPSPDIPIANACTDASRKGVIIVVASGNEGDDDPMTVELSYPAPQKETISIASVAKKHGLPVAFFSNTNDFNNYAAMGWDVTSYKAGTTSDYCRLSGTSMASPHCAGLIAMLLDQDQKHADCLDASDPQNNDKRVRDMLKSYTIDIGTPGPDPGSGLGFVSFLQLNQFNANFSSKGYQLPDLAHMDDPDGAPEPDEDDLAEYQQHQKRLRYKHRAYGYSSNRHLSQGYHEDDDDNGRYKYCRHITKRSTTYSYRKYKYRNAKYL